MTNRFSLRFDSNDGRIFILIDGQERFEICTECVLDSILARAPSITGEFSLHRTSEAERIIRYGYCSEGCCPSISAVVTFRGDKVSWADIRHSESPEDADGYEFDRDEYEAEINRVLLEWVQNSEAALLRLRAKTTGSPSAT